METILSILIWTLAFYGLFEIIKNCIYLYTCTKMNSKGTYVIIAVKNQEDTIEYFLRNFIFRIIYGKEEIGNIIVVDLNSKDNTKKIVEKLAKEYEQICLLQLKDLKELLEDINI